MVGMHIGVTQAIALIPPPPERGARAGLFIRGAQPFYYNVLNASNYPSRQ
jgi:hypothetical protein